MPGRSSRSSCRLLRHPCDPSDLRSSFFFSLPPQPTQVFSCAVMSSASAFGYIDATIIPLSLSLSTTTDTGILLRRYVLCLCLRLYLMTITSVSYSLHHDRRRYSPASLCPLPLPSVISYDNHITLLLSLYQT